MKVFLAVPSLLPNYGGPAFSISRLATALAQAGVEVGVWASDQSATATPLLSPQSSVRRLLGTERKALESYGKADVLHDNELWLPYHHRLAQLAAKQGIARVVSTRGNLEPWAMTHNQWKKWKKSLAWRLYVRRDLTRAWRHHATAETEARNVQRLGLGVPILVIPNGVDIPSRLPEVTGMEKTRQTRPRTVLFLGRIHPKKGLPMLVEAWARVRPRGWVLRIAGPDQMGHRAEIENAIVTAGLSGVVSFIGPILGQAKQCAFFEADLFVLPTHSENFGMAVAEALAHGLPVLTTTGAPWSMLPKRGCGWWVDASVDGIVEGLQRATSCDPEMLKAMGAKGREFVKEEFGWGGVAKQFIAAYQELRVGAAHT